jgi:hypothetical protein
MLEEWKKELSPEQIEEGNRRIARLAPGQPTGPLQEPDLEDQVEAKFSE